MLIIVVKPIGSGRFEAILDDRILCQSTTPFLSAARVLEAEGIPKNTKIIMRHIGQNHDALRSTVEAASKLAVDETKTTRFVKWRPFPKQ
jgi:hypothetical protein